MSINNKLPVDGRGLTASALVLALIQRSAWKRNSPKFAGKAEPYDCSVRTTRSEYVWCGEDPQPKEE
jgi:hypothetical protein